jgi:hypothetical protein
VPATEKQLTENERRAKRRERRACQRAARRAHLESVRARSPNQIIVVTPFLDWCALRGFSESTGRRLIKAGKVRITHPSARRIGVRSDDDEAYLASCATGLVLEE